MFATGVYQGRTTRTVSVVAIRDESEEDIVRYALHMAGKNWANMFDYQVEWSSVDSHSALVTLHLD